MILSDIRRYILLFGSGKQLLSNHTRMVKLDNRGSRLLQDNLQINYEDLLFSG